MFILEKGHISKMLKTENKETADSEELLMFVEYLYEFGVFKNLHTGEPCYPENEEAYVDFENLCKAIGNNLIFDDDTLERVFEHFEKDAETSDVLRKVVSSWMRRLKY